VQEIVAIQNQTMFDIAIQAYGSELGVFELAKDNGLSITQELIPGQKLKVDPAKMIDKSVVGYYQSIGYVPATGDSTECLFNGIGYMVVDLDFIVAAPCTDNVIGKAMIDFTLKITE
jgi:hypothetical protein